MRCMLPAAALLALAACGGGSRVESAEPSGSAAASVRAFLQAAKDSNLVRMAELWGNSSGSAARTTPRDYQRRVVVMQIYLRGDSVRVVGETPVPGDADRRTVTIALVRGTCVKQVPFHMVRSRDGWLVNNVDLNLAGNPARPCDPGTEGVPPPW